MCGLLIYYFPFVALEGPGARLRRPHPSADLGTQPRDNDLYNVFFNNTRIR
jgi:hypothetical protein